MKMVERTGNIERYNKFTNNDENTELTHDDVTKLLMDTTNADRYGRKPLLCDFELESVFRYQYDSHLRERAVVFDGQQDENEEESWGQFDIDLLRDMLDVGLGVTKDMGLGVTKDISFGWVLRNNGNLTIAIERNMARYIGITPEDNVDMMESTTPTIPDGDVVVPKVIVCEANLENFLKNQLLKCGCFCVGGKTYDFFSATGLNTEKQKLQE